MDARSLRPKRSVTAANGVAQPLAAPVGAAPAVPAAQQSALVPAPSAAAAPAVLTAEQRFAAARTLGADRAAVLRAAVARAPRSNYRKVVLKDKGTVRGAPRVLRARYSAARRSGVELTHRALSGFRRRAPRS